MKTISIEMSFDNTRLEYVGTTIYSILSTLEENYNIDFYFITKNVRNDDINNCIEPLKKMYPNKIKGIYHKDFEYYLDETKLKIINYENNSKYYNNIVLTKLYLFDIFPNLTRVIHLEDDILVTKSISNFWNIDTKSPIVVTENPLLPRSVEYIYKKYNMTSTFCVGVMILDLEYFRTNKMFDKILTIKNTLGNVPHIDETLINIAYKNLATYIEDNRFNFHPDLVEKRTGLSTLNEKNFDKDFGNIHICKKEDVSIIHWQSGSNTKPWSIKFLSPNNLYTKLWKKTYTEYNKIKT